MSQRPRFRAAWVAAATSGFVASSCHSSPRATNQDAAIVGPALATSIPDQRLLPHFQVAKNMSRLCCSTPAYGQTVQATGRLVRAALGRDDWVLRDVRLCLDGSDAGAL